MWLGIGMFAVLGLALVMGGLVLAIRRRNVDTMAVSFGALILVYALMLAVAWENRLTSDRFVALEAQLAKQQQATQNTAEQK